MKKSLKRIWKLISDTASQTLHRFLTKNPSNDVEALVFGLVRVLGDTLSRSLREVLVVP